MPSFQISISPSRRAAARFIGQVRRALLKALEEEKARSGLSQSDIARTIGVHRSVINRELRGQKDITLGRVGEIAHAMGRDVTFDLPVANLARGDNTLNIKPTEFVSSSSATSARIQLSNSNEVLVSAS